MLLAVIQQLTTAISAASPLVTIYPDERGVLLRFGKIKKELGQGIFFKVPFFHTIEKRCVAEASLSLNTQSLTTRDLKSVSVSGRLRYRISNVVKAHYSVFDLEEALTDEAEACLATAVRDRKIEDLVRESEEAESEVLDFLESAVTKWGVQPLDFTLTNLVITKNIRLLQE